MSSILFQTVVRRLYLIAERIRNYPAALAKTLWVPREDDTVIFTRTVDASYHMGGETFLSADGTLDHKPISIVGRVYPKGTIGTIGPASENYPVYVDGIAISRWLTDQKIQPVSLAKLKRKNSDVDSEADDAMPIAELLKRAVKRA